ncbi:hypothetical protein JB92DRAFT_3057210 [Gautieria morchelliformis]|nr:hypothetical protein JB92DRAFT_3057210 [Gautieria morchelliformis]
MALVRDVVERHNFPSSATNRKPFPNDAGGSSKTGFPVVQHRLKATSAFKRARLDQGVQRDMNVAREGLSKSIPRDNGLKATNVIDNSLEDISQSNAEAVEAMTEEERQRERQDIINQLGPGIGDLMSKVKEARARRADSRVTDEGSDLVPHKTSSTATKHSPPSSPPLSSTRRIRFVEPTDADIHVYESQPSSPKRTLALLPPPSTSQETSDILSLGTFKNSHPYGPASLQSSMQADDVADPPETGTPEDIRRRYFPLEKPPEDNPALTWLLPSLPPSSKPSDESGAKQLADSLPIDPRYSLSGVQLSPSQVRSLPTHLGLHHHASMSASLDTPAGYTLSDLLLLARSSVPAQRASILGVLAKILRFAREDAFVGRHEEASECSSDQVANIEAMRRDMLDAAMEALGEKGGVGQHAVDLLWEAIVGFIYTDFDLTDLAELPCIEFTPLSQPKHATTKKAMSEWGSQTNFTRHSLAILEALPLARILPALKIHLVTSPSPISLTHSRVLDVLFVLSHFSPHARAIVSLDAGVISAMMGPHLQSSSDFDSEQGKPLATLSSVRVLQALSRCGRDVAAALTGPADVLLRYIMTPLPPPDHEGWRSDGPSIELLTETLVFYALLAQYGIYAHVATTAQNEFAQIGAWLLTSFRVVAEPSIASLARAYLKLLEALIVCSTDPHKTTPSHDILWSQVRGWGWVDWMLDFTDVVAAGYQTAAPLSSAHRDARKEHEDEFLWTSIFHTLASWLESASLNSVRHGEGEKAVVSTRLKPIFESGCMAKLTVLDPLARLQVWSFPSSSKILLLEALHSLDAAAGLVAAVTRLALTGLQSEGKSSFEFPGQDIHNVCMRFLESEASQKLFNNILGFEDTIEMPEGAHIFVRPVTSLLVLDLQLWYHSITLARSNFMADKTIVCQELVTQALRILHTLLPGDEHYAGCIFEALCDNIDSDFAKGLLSASLPDEQWNKGGMKILLPFLTRSLRPQVANSKDDPDWREAAYIAPSSPTPESIARCTTLSLPSLSRLRGARMQYDQDLVLPLRSEWPTWPLDHLLRSSSSPVFRELPSDWDATETDVVRASLSLTRIAQELCSRGAPDVTPSALMSREEMIFACMKVFMLEHEQPQPDSGGEVFRDLLVIRWMNELLAPFTYANTRGDHLSVAKHGSSLEHISEAFLNTPFFQFYTDFLALYDAISFSQPLFGRLLLPPISMTYAIDYRKLLWGDYGHVIRTIKTGVDDLLCEDVREYLWPAETDTQTLGWYLKALLRSVTSGFIRWMAVHHLALNIWPDLRDEDVSNSGRAAKLLSAIVRQGSFDAIRDIALYRQLKDEVWVPPICYNQMDGDWVARRLNFVECMADQQVKEQLHGLFVDKDVM